MCLPPRIAWEKAEHKKFSVQGFWDEHFGQDSDDESSDDESSDGEHSDSGRPNDELVADSDDEMVGSDEEGSDDESSDDESSDGKSETDPDDDTASKKLCEEEPELELNYDALKHIAEHFLPGSHGACTDTTTRSACYTSQTAGLALAVSLAIPRTRFWNKSRAPWQLWSTFAPIRPFQCRRFTSSTMMRTMSLVQLSF
jgi:hypothetical protein